jgi:23S rRNA pseudouridine955/2504/2580 synthase
MKPAGAVIAERQVGADEEGQRLDRWFRRHFPALPHGRLERLLRTGQVRVDGRRVKAGHRVLPGQQVRVPPEAVAEAPSQHARSDPPVGERDRRMLLETVLHRDADILVLNKPPGLAVQGGSGIARHLDGMLDALRFEAEERPRLVHRLDRDTSGVLVLARTARAAAWLTSAFREGKVRKTYWAVVVGVPEPRQGRIDLALAKRLGSGGERVQADHDGRRAVTEYSVLDRAGRDVAWVAFRPLTGRTHQIRAHAAAIGTPILGDAKYGRQHAFLAGLGLPPQMHLHARQVLLPLADGGELSVTAPPPRFFLETLAALGFAMDEAR